MIKELFHFPYELTQARKAIVAFKNIKKEGFLKDGTYKLYLYGKPIIYNCKVKEIIDKYPAKYTSLFNRISLSGQAIDNKTFQADFIMVLAEGEYKLFDISSQVVYTKMSDSKKNAIIRGQLLFKDYFNTTFIREVSNGIVEKYIDYISIDSLQPDKRIILLEKIIQSYIDYTKKNSVMGTISKESCVQQFKALKIKPVDEMINGILRYIPEDIQMPSIYQHGDMHFGNILIDEQNTYIIDFEMFREELFFYDIMNCLYVEIVDKHKYDLIEWFRSDKTSSNALFRNLFFEMGMNFSCEKKQEYFAMFLLRRLYSDIIRAINRLSKNKTKKYLEYLVKKNKVILEYLEEFK